MILRSRIFPAADRLRLEVALDRMFRSLDAGSPAFATDPSATGVIEVIVRLDQAPALHQREDLAA